MSTTLRILILENEETAERSLDQMLRASDCVVVNKFVRTQEEFLHKLGTEVFDLIIVSDSVAGFSGEAALAESQQRCRDVPFVVISESMDDKTIAEYFRNGATDCILKSQLARLGSVVRRACREVDLMRKREQIEILARERTNFLQLQQVIAVAANEAASVNDALQAGLDLVCAYTGFPVGHAYVLDESDGKMVSANVWALSNPERFAEFRDGTSAMNFGRGEGLAGQVLMTEKPAWIEDLRAMKEFLRRELAERVGFVCAVAFPVFAGKSVVAILEFFSEKMEPQNQRLLDVMNYVGTQLGRVVEREQIDQTLKLRARREAAVARLAQRALQESNIDTFLHEATELIAEVLAVDFTGVLELTAHNEALTMRAGYGWQKSMLSFASTLSMAGYALAKNDLVISHDLEMELRFKIHSQVLEEGIRSGMVAVISVRGEQLGVVTAFSKKVREFRHGETSFLQTIADVLASAMERSRTNAELSLLHSAVEQTTEAITVTDANLDLPGPRILFVNAAFTEMTGWTAEEALGFSPRIMQGPKTDRAVLNALRARLANGENFDGEVINYRKDGTEFWLEWHIAPIRDANGNITQFFAIQRDVTDRKLAEKALRESQANLAAAQRITHLGSWELELFDAENMERNTLRWSDEVFRIFGYEPGAVEVSEENFMRLVHPDDREAVRATFLQAVKTRTQYSIDHRIVLPNGDERIVYEQAHLVPDEAGGGPMKMMGIVQDITDRRRNEEALRESEERFRATFEQAAVGILHVGLHGEFLRVNQRLCDLLGYSRQELRHKKFQEIIHADDVDLGVAETQKILAGEIQSYSLEKRYVKKSGETVWANLTTALRRDEAGEPLYFISVMEDISGRKRLEQQFLQAQKMEAFGRLAGGVAHDFNNLLTVISGYNSLMLDDLAPTDPRREFVEEVAKASDRASALTNQLLAFSRQQVLQSKVFDPNSVLENLEKMLRRIIGEDVQFVTELEPQLGHVRADISQIENVLVNLSVNARDAMPHGGTLTIRTSRFTATARDEERNPEMRAGDYICLSITDTGTGMSEEIKTHIFEPFFTTKEVGQGTGLGLATCYGIVSQSGGHITVESELGRGTTFKVFLPRVTEQTEDPSASDEFRELPRGTETILLVEDEPMVRRLTLWVLRALGYNLLEAANGEDAFAVMQTHGEKPLHLVITDVVMPHMSGKDLAFWIRASQPNAKILFISGYPNHELDDMNALGGQAEFLRKPFAPKELAHKVREMLDVQIRDASA